MKALASLLQKGEDADEKRWENEKKKLGWGKERLSDRWVESVKHFGKKGGQGLRGLLEGDTTDQRPLESEIFHI